MAVLAMIMCLVLCCTMIVMLYILQRSIQELRDDQKSYSYRIDHLKWELDRLARKEGGGEPVRQAAKLEPFTPATPQPSLSDPIMQLLAQDSGNAEPFINPVPRPTPDAVIEKNPLVERMKRTLVLSRISVWCSDAMDLLRKWLQPLIAFVKVMSGRVRDRLSKGPSVS